MADVRTISWARRRRDDLWIGLTALIAALLALPLAPTSWHGPEVAATLAVAATAMLAGERSAIAVLVVAELLMIPTAWPRALHEPDAIVRIAAIGTLITMVPGLLAIRRAAAALVRVSGLRLDRRVVRRAHAVLIVIGVIATSLPLFG